jgi:hypothetical protein
VCATWLKSVPSAITKALIQSEADRSVAKTREQEPRPRPESTTYSPKITDTEKEGEKEKERKETFTERRDSEDESH